MNQPIKKLPDGVDLREKTILVHLASLCMEHITGLCSM